MKRSPELVDAHSALWASALSGASGTAMFWWWERLDQRNFYPDYKPLSGFIADVPWNSGRVQAADISCSDSRVRALGLRANRRAWVWLYNRESAWANMVVGGRMPSTVTDATVRLKGMPAGQYHLFWWDTHSGKVRSEGTAMGTAQGVQFKSPPFSKDVACALLQ